MLILQTHHVYIHSSTYVHVLQKRSNICRCKVFHFSKSDSRFTIKNCATGYILQEDVMTKKIRAGVTIVTHSQPLYPH